MSYQAKLKFTENSENSVKWIEEAVSKNYFKYYEYKHFTNIQQIGFGGFGRVYRANWKNSYDHLALKSFFNFNDTTIKEIVNELKLQREVDFHKNIIRFCGITTKENQNDDSIEYMLVMEYADGGTLRNYLKKNFKNLIWDNKFDLAFQLAHAVSCLHDEGIVHRDLHSGNVLVHQNNIKLADFGLSRRIEEAANIQSKLFGVIPYIDPTSFVRQNNLLNKKSDIYSVGVLLWEISSGKPPFYSEGEHDIGLALEILQGLRETPIPDTPEDYIKIYTDCWSNNPDCRPTIDQVTVRLKALVKKECYNSDTDIQSPNEQQLIPSIAEVFNDATDNSLHGNLSQIIQNIDKMSTKDIEYLISSPLSGQSLSENYFSIIVDEIVDTLNKINEEQEKQEILNYLNSHDIHNVTLQEIFNWLLNNQNDNSNSIFLLGKFNYLGIGIDVNKQKAVELYQKAANLGSGIAQFDLGYCYEHGIGVSKNYKKAFELFKKSTENECPKGISELGYCYQYGIGTSIDYQKAFELYQKAADLGNMFGINYLGYCYRYRIGTSVNKKKAFELYQKAANLGDVDGINNLGRCYKYGIGTSVNKKKAFELYQKAANLGNILAINNLGRCYQHGIGTNINRQKAVELYQRAANLGNSAAQYNLALMYKNGIGIAKDIDLAIYWYKQSAEQGDQDAQTELEKLLNIIEK